MTADQIDHPDGRVELSASVTLSDPALYNDDLALVPLARRTAQV
jgi:hypothetical protein